MKNGPGALNRIYRLVWNEACAAFVAVAETTSARGKRASARTASALLGATMLAVSAHAAGPQPPPAQALPTGAQVAAGQAQVSVSGTRMDVVQGSAQAVLNWQSFNIGADAQVHFQQPSASAIALNRVLSADPSAIFGRLSANGQLMLLNPNGVVFGNSARVDVGGIAASTLQLSDADFLARKYQFTRDGGGGAVLNQGEVRAADGGYIALLAPEVRNEGVLQARLGTVAMAAGDAVTVELSDNALIGIKVDPASVATLVENRELVQAEGGRVLLSAGAAQRLAEQAIAGGSGGATTMVNDNGVMRLVSVGGRIEAGAGSVQVEGRLVDVSGQVTASGAQAGAIQVTADTVLQSGGLRADATQGHGGAVRLEAGQVVQTASARVSADGAAGGGAIRVDGGHGAASGGATGRVYSSATLSAQGTGAGAQGGNIDVSADSVQLRAATIDASGDAGGGRLRIGGGYQGQDTDITNAHAVGINSATQLRADARSQGDGGTVVVWSDGSTAFGGTIQARGGAAGGHGGMAEVSGKQALAFGGQADLSAARGAQGTLLLDPRDIVIDDARSTIASLSLDSPDGDTMARFGDTVRQLAGGHVVITAPDADTAGVEDTGAVYLFDSRNGALLGHLRGSQQADRVGNGGIAELDNGNYLVLSHDWNRTESGATYYYGSGGSYYLNSNTSGSAGAITWQSGAGAGPSASIVGTGNSLVGNQATNDRVADAERIVLSDGNLLFRNSGWNNGRGAVTWMDAATGQLSDGSAGGQVSAANSLVGTTPIRSTALQENGVFVTGVDSSKPTRIQFHGGAKNGTTEDAEALGAGDHVGEGGITVLAGGAYVVASPHWSNPVEGGADYLGAVTFGAAGGVRGAVSTDNSLHGGETFDFVGSKGVVAVGAADAHGLRANYLVLSPHWASGGHYLQSDARGAVTWVDGQTGRAFGETGPGALVGSTNSLVGAARDMIGTRSIHWQDEYQQQNQTWSGYYYYNNGRSEYAGTRRMQTWESPVTVLDNGNYVVSSIASGNGKGSVTFGFGATGVAGQVSADNSLVGRGDGDAIGSGGIVALAGGRYAVVSPQWDDVEATDAGAVTWGSASGVTGEVSVTNSLVGGGAFDRVGSGGVRGVGQQDAAGRFANYIVLSPTWDSTTWRSVTGRGAVTWIDGSTGHTVQGQAGAVVGADNSLVGAEHGDYVGSLHHSNSRYGNWTGSGVYTNPGEWDAQLWSSVDVLANGNYLVRSPNWGQGKGAATWGDGGAGVAGVVGADNSLVGSRSTVVIEKAGTYTPVGDQYGRTFETVTYTMSQSGDHVGLMSSVLPNGYVAVLSPFWNDGRGAVTLIDGGNGRAPGVQGPGATVSAANSLVGSTPDTYAVDGNGGRTALLGIGDHVGVRFYNEDLNYEVPVTSTQVGDSSVVTGMTRVLLPYQLSRGYHSSYSWIDPDHNPESPHWWDHQRTVQVGREAYFSSLPEATIDQLPGGDLLVRSPLWNNGQAQGAGAVTWMNGRTGQLSDGSFGAEVSAANSLVGSLAGDAVGRYGISDGDDGEDYYGYYDYGGGADFDGFHSDPGAGVVTLANGNVVVRTSNWGAGRGAATWMDGRTGQLSDGSTGGAIDATNSLVGAVADNMVDAYGWHRDANGNWVEGEYKRPDGMGDRVAQKVYALANGDYLVGSSEWGKVDEPYRYRGAVTWADGATGQLRDGQTGGEVSASNSLVGTQGGDAVGSGGVYALDGGRFVVRSPEWANGAHEAAGAVTWNPAGGIVGAVSADNSLVGARSGERIGGSGVTVVRDAQGTFVNYLVRSGAWNDGQGAVTWVDGQTGRATGASGPGATVSIDNSLVGRAGTSNYFGDWFEQLTLDGVATGDVVFQTGYWESYEGLAGTVTLMPGASGLTGELGWRNSLVGFQGTAAARVGWADPNFIVLSDTVGADEKVQNRVLVTTWNGSARGLVLSVVDENPAYPLGTVGHTEASVTAGNGNAWTTAGFAADPAGFAALGGTAGQFGFDLLADNNLVLTPGQLTHMLNAGTAVTLQASNSITVAKAVLADNPDGVGGNLTLTAGRNIRINADIHTDGGNFTAIANAGQADGAPAVDCGGCAPGIVMRDGVRIDAGDGAIDMVLRSGDTPQGDIVLGDLLGRDVRVRNEHGDIRGNTGAALQWHAASQGGVLELQASGQLQLASGETPQTLSLQGETIALRAGGMRGSSAGSLTLGDGVQLTGSQLHLAAFDAAALAQFGGTSLRDGFDDQQRDFWLSAQAWQQLMAQSIGLGQIRFGDEAQEGATHVAGFAMADMAANAVTVLGGSGGVWLDGGFTLGAGSRLTVQAEGGAVGTVDGWSAGTNGSDSAATLTLRGEGVSFDHAQLDLAGARLVIDARGTGPVQVDAEVIQAGTLELHGTQADFDLTAGVMVDTLAADVRTLRLANLGDLVVGVAGTLSGVQATHGVLIEAGGAGADLVLDAPVRTLQGDIVLSAGRDFINNNDFGTGLDAGQGRYLVYSADPTRTLEGMAVQAKHYDQTYTRDQAPAYAAQGNWFLYAVAPELVVTPGALSTGYGSRDADVLRFQMTGFIDGDTAQSAGIGGNLQLVAEAATSSGAGYRPAGVYATWLESDQGGPTSILGYRFVVDPGHGSLEVVPRELAAHGRFVDDGQNRVDAGALVLDAALSGDAVTLVGSGQRPAGAGVDRPVATGTLALRGADAGNYRLASVSATVTPQAQRLSAEQLTTQVGAGTPMVGGPIPVQVSSQSDVGIQVVPDGAGPALQPGRLLIVGTGGQLALPLASDALIVRLPQFDLRVQAGTQIDTGDLKDLFEFGGQPSALSLSITMEDGSALPAWLVFDAGTGRLQGTVPADAGGPLRLRILARDANGREASSVVAMQVAP